MKIQNNLVFKYLKLNYIWPFITFFLIIIVPQIYFYQDLWDGTIYNYAQDINNFDSAKLILYEAGWILNFWFIFLTIKISNFFNVEFYTTSLIFLSFFYLFFLREISLFLEHERIKNPKIKLFILLLVSAFSIQSYFYSSIFVWHSFCQLCFFMGVRLYYESSNLKFLFSLLLLFFAFSFKSALLFIIILSFTYEKKISSKKVLFLILYGLIIFINFHFIFKNFGKAEGYAQLLIPNNIENLNLIFKSFATYITFLIPLFFTYLVIFVISLFKNINIFDLKILLNFLKKNYLYILLFFSAIIPYISIGRFHVIWDVFDWSGRNAILIIFPISYLSIRLFEQLRLKNKINSNTLNISFLILFSINLILLLQGTLFKLNRIIYQEKLSQILIENESDLRNHEGVLVINDNIKIKPIFRVNEINYLVYKSIHNNNLWTVIQNEKNKKYDANYPNNGKYKDVYVSNFYSKKKLNSVCLIEIKISSENFSTMKDKIFNIFFKDHSKISLVNLSKRNCP